MDRSDVGDDDNGDLNVKGNVNVNLFGFTFLFLFLFLCIFFFNLSSFSFAYIIYNQIVQFQWIVLFFFLYLLARRGYGVNFHLANNMYEKQ